MIFGPERKSGRYMCVLLLKPIVIVVFGGGKAGWEAGAHPPLPMARMPSR